MNAALAINLLLALLDRAQIIGELLNRAKSEGRDISDAELDQLAAGDDAAKAILQAEIDKRKG